MADERSCPHCGKPVPPSAPGGICPECLLKAGLAAQTEGPGATGPHGTKVVAPLPKPEEIAPLFPQLEILDCLGRGGMGVVYKARQPRLNRLVALKILAREKEQDSRFAERFTREAQALARLNHPNIVTVHDFGEAAGHGYLIMEFVDGLNLRQLLQGGNMPPEQALTIVPKICEALQYAHEQGIVHRDIKPENILLDKQGRVKIADFGIAKMVGAETGQQTLTGAKDTVGTPHYMAPEQIEKPLSVDHRADIYSLGVVFYEMLTGELPLGKFQPPSKKVHVDVRLDEVVLHALEKEPERRYQQASVLKTEVETIVHTPSVAGGEKRLRSPLAISNATPFSRFIFWAAIPIFGWYFFLLLNDHFNGTNQKLWHYFSYVFFTFAAICCLDTAFRIRRGLRDKTSKSSHEHKSMYATMLFSGALALVIILVFVGLPAWRMHLAPHPDTTFYVGQTWFPRGDSIEISSVERAPHRVTVKGHYKLVSHDNAELALYVTATNLNFPQGPGGERRISIGHGDFTLVHMGPTPGWPHVSMYGSDGHPFASVYFGTKAEALAESRASWITNVPTTPAGPGLPTFGRVTERILKLNDSGLTDILDLDSGKVSPPPQLKSPLDAAFASVVMPTGVAIISSTAQHPVMLIGRQTSVAPLPEQNGDREWNDMSPQQLTESYANDFTLENSSDTASASGKLPYTFIFKTLAGRVGLLQITGFTDNPRGVKIRYKLVEVTNSKRSHSSSSLEPADLREARLKLAELRVSYGEQSPEIQTILARIKELERMTKEEPNASEDLREAEAHLAELRVEYGEQNPKIQGALARIKALEENQATRIANVPLISGASGASRLSRAGWQLWHTGKLAEAEEKFQQAVQLAPEDANAWNGLGWVQFNSGNSRDAEKAFQKAVSLDANQPGALNGLGQIYLSERKYNEAEAYFLKAAPQAPAAWYGLTRLYLLEGRYGQAEKWAQDLIDSGQADDLVRQMLKSAQEKHVSEALKFRIEPPIASTSGIPSTLHSNAGSTFQFRLVLPQDSTAPADSFLSPAGPSPLRVSREVLLDDTAIAQAGVDFSPEGRREIQIRFTDAGAKQFEAITATNVGHQLAIVFRGQVLSAPVIQATIPGGECQVDGSMNAYEIDEIVDCLNHVTRLTSKEWNFSPVHERVLPFRPFPNALPGWLDLDSGIILTNSSLDLESRSGYEWIRTNGLDLVTADSAKHFPALFGVDMIVVSAPTNGWNIANAADVVNSWPLLRDEPRQRQVFGVFPGQSGTFFFQTREGGRGILQILGFVHNSSGVKIRYKLVQNRPRNTTPANNAGIHPTTGLPMVPSREETATRPAGHKTGLKLEKSGFGN